MTHQADPDALPRLPLTPTDFATVAEQYQTFRLALVWLRVVDEDPAQGELLLANEPGERVDSVRWTVYRDTAGLVVDNGVWGEQQRCDAMDEALRMIRSTIEAERQEAVMAIPATFGLTGDWLPYV